MASDPLTDLKRESPWLYWIWCRVVDALAILPWRNARALRRLTSRNGADR